MVIAKFPEHGEADFLVRVRDSIIPDDPFLFCPLCGTLLLGIIGIPHEEHLQKFVSSFFHGYSGGG